MSLPVPSTRAGLVLPRRPRWRLATAVGLLLSVAAALPGCGSTDTGGKKNALPTVRLLTPGERALHLESFDTIWTTIHETHFDPEFNGVDWEGKRVELRPRVENAKTAEEARDAMNALIHSLGQSHFGLVTGDVYDEISGEAEDAPKGGNSSVTTTTVRPGETVQMGSNAPRNREGEGDPGFEFIVIDDEAVVSRVEENSPAAARGVQLGWVLEAIDGVAIARTIERFADVGTGRGEMAIYLHRSIRRKMNGNQGESVDLRFLDAEGKAREVTVTLAAPRGEKFALGNMPAMRVEWEIERRGEIGYFRLSAFFQPRVRAELAAFIAENLDARGFIVDLRGNPGGIGFLAGGLSGLFVEEAKTLGTMITRESEMHFGIFPQAVTFLGPLALLIDGGSASTSEIMAAGLKDLGRARLFGTNTAGAALPSTFIRLPNGDGFQYAIANYVSSGGDVIEGAGVAPDVVVRPDRQSLLRGVDPVIEAATTWILESQ